MGPGSERLQEIDHIVVLMLENRSFDHMLGYLSLPESAGGRGRTDIDGLTGGDDQSNYYDGDTYSPQPLDGYLSFPWDPPHDHKYVVKQIANNNSGFVEQFAKHHHQLYRHVPLLDPGLIMGYHTADHVPAFDQLARQFCVCDRWYSSLPGPTFPNRYYAMAGTSSGYTHDPDVDDPAPVDLKTIFDYLPERSWGVYFHDAPSIWLFKDHRHLVKGRTTHSFSTFRKHAKQGTLPSVSWIDPYFHVKREIANDDHPPSDVRRAQRFVAEVYNLLLASPVWNKTLLVIYYDEHGGFYDHVSPPEAEDDFPHMARYGVRVPAIIVSPWVAEQSVSHTTFDHTSVIKTILLRFCRQFDGSIPSISRRTDAATDLSCLLTESAPRACEPIRHPINNPNFPFQDRGEPDRDWGLRKLMRAVHTDANKRGT
ncbi:MAG: alkaline phosphatase family protein [Caldilineales bacterium]